MSKIMNLSNKIELLIKDIDNLLNNNRSVADVSTVKEEYNQIFSEVKRLNLRTLFDKSIKLVRVEILDNWKIYCDDCVKLSEDIFNDNPETLDGMRHNLSQINHWLTHFIALNILEA